MQRFRYVYPLKVRWSEVDPQGIVFNANYLLYLDLAYQAYLKTGLAVTQGIPSTVLAKSTLTFLAPATFDDDIQVWVHTERIGRSSMNVRFRIDREQETLLEAEHVYVYVDVDEKKPMAVPQTWRDAIDTYEQGR